MLKTNIWNLGWEPLEKLTGLAALLNQIKRWLSLVDHIIDNAAPGQRAAVERISPSLHWGFLPRLGGREIEIYGAGMRVIFRRALAPAPLPVRRPKRIIIGYLSLFKPI